MTDIIWTNITIKLGALQPWPGNPKTSTAKDARALLKSWDELGQFQTIAIGPEPHDVYDGHQRLSALLTVHGPEYEVEARQSSRALTDEERRKIAVYSRQIGAWDWGTLSGWNVPELMEWGFDADLLKTWNNDANNLKEMLRAEQPPSVDADVDTDRAAELLEKWQCKTGDLWQIGNHRLACGDCTDPAVVARVMDGESIDLVMIDPPYSVDYAAKNRALQTIGRSNRLTTDIEGDTLDTEETAELIWKPAFKNAYEKSRNGTVIYSFAPQGGDQMMMMMMMIKAEWNKRLHQLIWRKNAPTFSMGRLDYQYQHEPILYSWRGTNHGYYGEIGRSVIDCNKPSASGLHPTMKPVEILEKLIGNSSKVNEFVYDCFCGSGSSMVACENLQRRCRAIEISPSYVSVALERMSIAFPALEIKRIA